MHCDCEPCKESRKWLGSILDRLAEAWLTRDVEMERRVLRDIGEFIEESGSICGKVNIDL